MPMPTMAMATLMPMVTTAMLGTPMLVSMAMLITEFHLDPVPGLTPSLRDLMHPPRAFSQSITIARGPLMPMPMLMLMLTTGSVMAIPMHMVTMAMLDILVMPMFPSDQALVSTQSLKVWMLPHRDTSPMGTTMAT